MGVAKDGTPSGQFARGMELHARQTIFAEGARGSCSEEVMAKFNLREGAQPQTFGIGVKEVWQVPEENLNPGFVQHTLGWPVTTLPSTLTTLTSTLTILPSTLITLPSMLTTLPGGTTAGMLRL